MVLKGIWKNRHIKDFFQVKTKSNKFIFELFILLLNLIKEIKII